MAAITYLEEPGEVRQWTDDGIAKARTAGASVASKANGLASDVADTAVT